MVSFSSLARRRTCNSGVFRSVSEVTDLKRRLRTQLKRSTNADVASDGGFQKSGRAFSLKLHKPVRSHPGDVSRNSSLSDFLKFSWRQTERVHRSAVYLLLFHSYALSPLSVATRNHANTPVAIAEPKKPKPKPRTDGGDKEQQQDARAGAPPPVVAVKIKAKRKE